MGNSACCAVTTLMSVELLVSRGLWAQHHLRLKERTDRRHPLVVLMPRGEPFWCGLPGIAQHDWTCSPMRDLNAMAVLGREYSRHPQDCHRSAAHQRRQRRQRQWAVVDTSGGTKERAEKRADCDNNRSSAPCAPHVNSTAHIAHGSSIKLIFHESEPDALGEQDCGKLRVSI